MKLITIMINNQQDVPIDEIADYDFTFRLCYL